LVPEFLQAAVTPENLGRALLEQLQQPALRAEQLAEYQRIHALLRRGASEQSAEVVLALVAAGRTRAGGPGSAASRRARG
jgi:lipid-A-disaccharide synthase